MHFLKIPFKPQFLGTKKSTKALKTLSRMCCVFCFCFCIQPLWAWNHIWTVDTTWGQEVEVQLDPYYSALGFVSSLSTQAVPRMTLAPEQGMYLQLLQGMWQPDQILAEFSVNPLPVIGVGLRSHSPDFYAASEVGGTHLVRSLTTGFPEPWAQSLFLGKVLHFQDSAQNPVGRGYAGFLFSWGLDHLAYNRWVDAPWIEGEIKLKGTWIHGSEEAGYSYAIGAKEHFHGQITDLLRFAIRRSHVDRQYKGWSWTKNADLEWRIDLDRDKALEFWDHWFTTGVRYSFLWGKKWPQKHGVLSLGLGLAWEVRSGYGPHLAEESAEGWGLILRPNWVF
jgi:hypothetical protein